MKAIISTTTNEVKVIANNIVPDPEFPVTKFDVTGDIKDSVSEYGLKYPNTEVMSVVEIGDSYPEDWASDKYLWIDGAFVVNPDYVAPTF